MQDFEVFGKDAGPARWRPLVTIQRRGIISLNAAAHEALGAPPAVELLYDAAARVVGLRPGDPRARHSYLVRPTGRPTGRSGGAPFVVSASAFTRYYGIDTSVALRRVGRLEDGILCVDLDGDPAPGSGETGGHHTDE